MRETHASRAATRSNSAGAGGGSTSAAVPVAEVPLLLDMTHAAEFLGYGRDEFRRRDQLGLVPDAADNTPGCRRRWSSMELREWVAAGCPARVVWNEIRRAT